MARKSPYRPFHPNPAQLKLVPEVSGNAINGLGERSARLPRPVYWADPDTLAHGALQQWFYTNDPDNPVIGEARRNRAEIMDRSLAPLAPQAVDKSAEDWLDTLLEFANGVDLEMVGVAAVQPEWLFADAEVPERWIVMIGVAHDYEQISTAPAASAGAEVVRQYGRALKATQDIASWFRRQGHEARPLAGPMAGPMQLIPAALACGFGELGRHGSIINDQWGSSFRLAGVLTNAPLLATPPLDLGVDDFCSRCQVCNDACPPEAILPEKQWVRGQLKWYVDFDRCLPFFNETFGCGICIAVCPWSIPGRGPRILEQLRKRKARTDSDGT